jgi:WD40 repeat protein
LGAVDDTLATNPNAQPLKPATGEDLPFEAQGRYGGEETEIGRGGIGRVVVRTDVHLGREVAVKELLPEFQPARGSTAQQIAERFLTEARVTARLEHPGIVPVYELGRRSDGSLYYSMKRVRGRTLAAALEDCGSLDDRLSLLPHVLDVVQTLAYAHSNGVIHRDLKPQNVMVGAFGETQVLDWGLARVRGVTDEEPTRPGTSPLPPASSSSSAGTTQHGQLLGTPSYMSPEQAMGDNAKVDERSDVWALGALLFELLTGQTPFEGDTAEAMLSAVKHAPVRKVRQLEANAPIAVAAVVDHALQRDPEGRYANAVEMAEALELAMRGSASFAGRRLRKSAVFASVVTLLLVLAVGRMLSAQNDADEARALAEQMHLKGARTEAAVVARLAREQLEKKNFALAEALAHQALDARGAEPEALARGILAVLEGAPRPVLRWDVKTPGCAGLTAEHGLVACPTFGGVEVRKGDSGDVEKTLSAGPTGWQHAALFMADGTLVSAGDDRLVHVWDTAQGTELAHWSGHAAPIYVMAMRGGTLATGAMDGEVRVWEASTGTSKLLAKHAGPVRALAFTREGLLASSGPDGLRLWNVDKPEPAPKVSLDRPAQVLLPSGDALLFGVERTVFSFQKDDAWPRVEGALDDVTALAAVPGLLLAGDARGRLRAVDAQGGLQWELSGVERGVRAMAVDADQPRQVIVASRGHALQAWEFPEELGGVHAGDAVAWGWCEGNDGRSAVLLGERNGRVRNGEGRVLFEGPGARVRALAGGKANIVWGGDDGVVWLWSEAPKELARRSGKAVTAVAVSADGALGAFGFEDGSFVLQQLPKGLEVASSRGAVPQVIAFSRDGKWLAVGRDDKHVVLVDTATGAEGHLFEVDAAPTALAFHGDTLAVGLEHGAVLIALAAKRELGRVGGAGEPVRSLSFSSDGKQLIGGSDDGQAYVWDVAAHRTTHIVPLDAGDVTLVRFVDKEHVVVAGSDHTLRALRLRSP